MAITIVHTTTSGSLTPTIPSTTAGNCLVVCVMSDAGASSASVTGITLGGSAGNFGAQVTKTEFSGISQIVLSSIWADPNCAGGQTAVSISGTNLAVNSTSGGIVIWEVAGLALTQALLADQSSTGGATSGSGFNSGTTATTTQASEFWVGCSVAGGTVTAPGAPWTDSGAGFTYAAAGYQIKSSTGTATYSGTSSSAIWAASVVTLKAALPPLGRTQNINQSVMRAAIW